MQRYQASDSLKETNKSLWTSGILALISALLSYGMSTMLYPLYAHETILPKSLNTSSVVLYFILTEMPPFVAGLLIAAIFAVTQSTISSSLNSMSICTSIDAKQHFFGKGSEWHEVNFARFIIIITGTFGFGMLSYLIASNSNDLWGLFLFVTGLFGVPLAGVFVVGIFIKCTNTLSVICRLIPGITSAYVYNGVGKGNPSFYVPTISFTIVFVFTYIPSFIAPSKHKKDIAGLTIFEKDKSSIYISKMATKK